MPKRGERATPEQRAALKRGQSKRAKALKDGGETAVQRMARLLDGSLTVAELTDEEIDRGRVYGKGKQFSGPGKALPSHLYQAFMAERIKRANLIMAKDVQKAARLLGKIIDDPEAKHADQIKAASMLLDRQLGRVPETVNLRTDDHWGDLMRLGGTLEDHRDLSSLADGSLGAEDFA